ncbi:DUF721 domain-containing protein [Gephyromycinifex aptenodytis]|uniref:DUF721 domain-containing protein n=1 Tax=Gephyromycinifex aptenodytis TaxID=2716227 RepID=UPI001444B60B|nr:DciA family protein [Gephyromycinifex aptenodytis]
MAQKRPGGSGPSGHAGRGGQPVPGQHEPVVDAVPVEPGVELPVVPTISAPDGDESDRAAAAALARAREAARAKGLRPGSRPVPRRRRRTEAVFSGSNADGRDPLLLGDGMDRLLLDRGWKVDVAAGAVMGRWPAIVGLDVARHCTPVTFEDGVLIVRADSTAWATQLRLMAPNLLQRLGEEAGQGVVTELRVVGPAAPSWSRGPRRSTGPGPRDTYG